MSTQTKAVSVKKKSAQEAKASVKKPVIPWKWISLTVTILALTGIGVTLSLLQDKALQVQQLRSQGISAEMTEQDSFLLQQNLEKYQTEREELAAAFPKEENVLEFVSLIDEIRDSEVEVVRFSLDSDIPTKIGRSPSFLPMTLTLKGSETEVISALNTLTASPYFFNVITFSKELVPETNRILVSTQFHLFVSDNFFESNSE